MLVKTFALKLAKTDKIKLLYQLACYLDENRQNLKNLQNVKGFQFQLSSNKFKAKLCALTNKCSKLELIGIANLLAIETKKDNEAITHKNFS